MDVKTINTSNFTVAGQAVEKIENIQYLGSQLASDGGTNIDIGARIKKARAKQTNRKKFRLILLYFPLFLNIYVFHPRLKDFFSGD